MLCVEKRGFEWTVAVDMKDVACGARIAYLTDTKMFHMQHANN
jgi:hypothetical protein